MRNIEIERRFLKVLAPEWAMSYEHADTLFHNVAMRCNGRSYREIRENVEKIAEIDRWISDKGLPIDREWLDFVEERSPEVLHREALEFNRKWPLHLQIYPQSFRLNNDFVRSSLISYGYEPEDRISIKNLDPWKNIDTFPGHLRNILKLKETTSYIVKGFLRDNFRGGRVFYTSLYPYASKTGRFQPKSSEGFVFQYYKPFRTCLNPPRGKWLVDIDYHAQEMAIQAVLSGDKDFHDAYINGDVYANLGRVLGIEDRRQAKQVVIPWSYGAGDKTLGKIGFPCAASILSRRYPTLTAYKKQYENYQGFLWTPDCFGVDAEILKPSARINWPFQAFGAYILREVVKKFYEEKIPIIATVHDAVVLEVDENDWDTIDKALEIMSKVPKELLQDDILTCTRDQVAIWKHHTLDDLLNLEHEEFVSKVGDLVAWDDVLKFRKLFGNMEETTQYGKK